MLVSIMVSSPCYMLIYRFIYFDSRSYRLKLHHVVTIWSQVMLAVM